MESEHPQTVETALAGLFGSLSHRRFGKSGKIRLVIYRHRELVGGFEQIAVELDKELGKLVVHLHKLFLLVGGKGGSLLSETAVVFLHHSFLHRREAHLVAHVVDAFDALEESVVEVHLVGGFVEHRYGLLRHRGELGSGERLLIMVEHPLHTLKNRREILERKNGVVEIGNGAVARDVAQVLILLGYTGLDSRNEIRNLYLVEGRDAILRVVGLQKGIFSLLCHDLRTCGEQKRSGRDCE